MFDRRHARAGDDPARDATQPRSVPPRRARGVFVSRVKPTLTGLIDPESDPALEVGLAAFSRSILLGIILATIVFCAAAVSISKEFIEHDRGRVVENRALRALPGLRPIWRQALQFPDVSPITYTSFLIEARLWGTSRGNSAIGFRFVNACVHVLAVLALWHLLRRLELPGAWAAAALFGVHPAAMATVGWVSQRPILLGTLFGILTLIVFLRLVGVNPVAIERHRFFRLPDRPALLIALCLALAGATALSHPGIALVLWPITVILVWWEKGQLSRRDWRCTSPLIITSGLVLLGWGYLLFTRGGAELQIREVSFITRPVAAVQQLAFYAFHAVLPVQLRFAYEPFRVTTLTAVAAVMAVVIALSIVVWAGRKWGRGVVAACATFLVIMLPSLIWVEQAELFGGWVSTHRIYPAVPVVVSAVAAMVASVLVTRRERAQVVAAVAVLAVGAGGIHQSWLYRSQARLWNYVLEHNPSNITAGLRRAEILAGRGEMLVASRVVADLVRNHPNEIEPVVHLAAIELKLRQIDRARPLLFNALLMDPDHFDANHLMAQLMAESHDSGGALRQYDRALQLRPFDVHLHNNMGRLHVERGELPQARERFERAVELDPQFSAARINLANLLYQLGDIDAAGAQLTAVVRYDPENYEAFMNAGAMLGQAREFGKAADLFRMSIALRPEMPDTYSNLAMALLGQAENPSTLTERKVALYTEAAFMFEKAAELAPERANFGENARGTRAALEKLQADAQRR